MQFNSVCLMVSVWRCKGCGWCSGSHKNKAGTRVMFLSVTVSEDGMTDPPQERNKGPPRENRGKPDILDLKRLRRTSNRRWHFEINKLPEQRKGSHSMEMRISISLSLFLSKAQPIENQETPMGGHPVYPRTPRELPRQNVQELLF